MLREGEKGLSQDAGPGGVRLEGRVGEAEQEMLVAVCLRVGTNGWTQVSRPVPSAEPSTEGLHPDRGAATVGAALLRELALISPASCRHPH